MQWLHLPHIANLLCCGPIYRACKSRGLVFILKTSGALRLSLRYFNIGIPIQKVKFVFEDVVDEQFAELSKKNY